MQRNAREDAMNGKTREQLIVELWEKIGADSLGAAKIGEIQQELGAGAPESPALIARVLADHGVRLQHPDILQSDINWRAGQMFALFSPEEVNFGTIADASSWIEKLDELQRRFEVERDAASQKRLRQFALRMKEEIELVAVSKRTRDDDRQLAQEVAQWLTVWLQNPQIFPDWLALRRATPEFQQRFAL